MVNAEIVGANCAMLQATRPEAVTRSYRATIRDFGKAGIELMVYVPRFSEFATGSVSSASVARELTELEKREASLARSVRRAKQRVRWLCKAIEADHLVTLTYRENVTDEDRVAKDWQRFVRLVREVRPDWRYVMVRERHSLHRDGWHMHVAVHGRQDIRLLRRSWWAIVGEAQGNIDVSGPSKRWGRMSVRWSAAKLAGYMTKYVAKDFALSQAEKKRYWASKGADIPKAVYWLGATNFPEALKEIYEYAWAYGVKQSSVWASDDWRVIWIEGSG